MNHISFFFPYNPSQRTGKKADVVTWSYIYIKPFWLSGSGDDDGKTRKSSNLDIMVLP